jgi:sulfite reductase (NADPH) hemoprotein beta-component
VKALGVEEFTAQVEREFAANREFAPRLDPLEVARVSAHFRALPYATLADIDAAAGRSAAFQAWYRHNTRAHKVSGYRIVFLSLKKHGVPPGDITSAQLDAVAALAEQYSFALARVTHDQNLVLADVRQMDLHALWQALEPLGLATPNIGTLTDMICCPGLDFCSLANAGTIAVARAIQERCGDFDYLYDLGPIEIKMSGCMNACGQHHVGHIGILGVDKHGEEWYQIQLGGSARGQVALGEVLGPSVRQHQLPEAIDRILDVYVRRREDAGETFLETVRRIGIEPFQERVYAQDHQAA